MVELADSHCHIQSIGASVGETMTRELWSKSVLTANDVLQRAREAQVTRLLVVGCDVDDSALATEFAAHHDSVWASIGIHPHEASRFVNDEAALKTLAALAALPKVVAIGECGLDYYYEHSDRTAQAHILEFQLALAAQHDLPVVFHVRDAFDDFWPIFERFTAAGKKLRGVLHSFTDSPANLERALSHGLYIGVNGIATFTKNGAQQAMYRTIPLDKLLLETDAPFLTPAPYRGTICEPKHVRATAEYLAQARHESLADLAAASTKNFKELFGV